MKFNSGARWILITYIAATVILSSMLMLGGCSGGSSSVTPTSVFTPEGRVNLEINTVNKASVTYGRGAPEFFVHPEIPLKQLYSVGLFVSRITLIGENGEESNIYQEDGLISEPTFFLRDDYENTNTNFLNDATVKAVNYVRMEMSVGRVWTRYQTDEDSEIASWDAQSYNRNIILNSFSPVKVKPGETVNISANFDIGGRVGMQEGEFYPFAYITKE
ncbi:MAG: hypothetical protein ACQESP_08845 [Candidatus Muiribacteriota bacterium]